jgi:hypothetical protein
MHSNGHLVRTLSFPPSALPIRSVQLHTCVHALASEVRCINPGTRSLTHSIERKIYKCIFSFQPRTTDPLGALIDAAIRIPYRHPHLIQSLFSPISNRSSLIPHKPQGRNDTRKHASRTAIQLSSAQLRSAPLHAEEPTAIASKKSAPPSAGVREYSGNRTIPIPTANARTMQRTKRDHTRTQTQAMPAARNF